MVEGDPCPGSPLSLHGLRAVESGDPPCQCLPCWAPGKPPHCWHPNEKVNIEPQGFGGQGVPRGPSCLGPAWLSQAPGKGQTGEQLRGRGGVSSLRSLAERGPFGIVVSRSRPLARPFPPAPGPVCPEGAGTLPPGGLWPHRVPPLCSAFTFQRLKCLFL